MVSEGDPGKKGIRQWFAGRAERQAQADSKYVGSIANLAAQKGHVLDGLSPAEHSGVIELRSKR